MLTKEDITAGLHCQWRNEYCVTALPLRLGGSALSRTRWSHSQRNQNFMGIRCSSPVRLLPMLLPEFIVRGQIPTLLRQTLIDNLDTILNEKVLPAITQ